MSDLTLLSISGALRAGSDETATNPRARSAVMRVAEKLPAAEASA